MFPILYKKDETDFVHNGLGVLSGAITTLAEEELNGLFEIKIEYDSEGFLADKIENGMIVKAKANDRQMPQLFRIYAIEKSLQNDHLIVHGQHITYDLAGNFVEKLVLNNATTREAMEAIKANLAYPTRFNITSTNNTTTSSTSLYRTNPLQMIAGMEGSILQFWGGQIERDNFNLIMHTRRGSDDGVLVTYKKNLTGLEAKFDESQVVTRIFPFKYIEETNKLITIDGKYIDSSNINKYPVIKILPVDFSDDESIKNKMDLYNASKNYFKTGSKDLPTVEMDVEFEPLHGTEEYKDVAALELVGMGDTITVHHSKMGIDVKAQVIKIEYDSITEKNRKVSLGNVKARLTDKVNHANNMANTIDDKIQNVNEKVNEAIRAANGKNTIFYGPEEPTGAQEGDLWFKTVDGDYTRTYRFDGVQWQLVVSVDVRDAMQDAKEARNRADEAVEKANLATNNANEAIEQAQGAFDEATNAHNIADSAKKLAEAANDQYSTLEQTVEGITIQVAKKVDQTVYDTFVQQTEKSLTSKVSQADFDSNNHSMNERFSSITQTVDGIQTQVSDNKGNISKVTQLANALQTRMTNAEGSISTLTQTASSLQSTISSVRNDLDNMEIGGRNLLTETSDEWTDIRVTRYTGAVSSRMHFEDLGLQHGDVVTFSLNLKAINKPLRARIDFYTSSSGDDGKTTFRDSNFIEIGEEGRSNVTVTLDKSKPYIILYVQNADTTTHTSTTTEQYKEAMFERGNKATDWSPSPKDLATQSQISQLSDAINLRVQKGDVINQINVDTSGVLIQGKKLILDGDTTVTGTFKVNNANIVSVDAGKVTTGTLDAGKVSVININASNIKTGKLNANAVTISAANGLAKVDLSSTGLHSYDSDGKMRIALNIRSAGGAGSDPSTLRFFSGSGSASAGIGMNVNDTFVIGSTSNDVIMELYSGRNTNIYCRQMRVVTKEGTSSSAPYNDRYFIFGSVKNSNTGNYNPGLYPDSSGWGYIGRSNYRMWRMYTNYLHYIDLVKMSTRDSKANIKDANLNQMQSAFDGMSLVTFNYKNEDGSPRDDELKVGFIAEDSPDLITSKDKKQISLDNIIGVMAGALKFQQQRIDQLEIKIAKLEGA
ncbi:phage tail spike protein [Halalkalibacterium halodurans]|uniref:phage tail spike protein n=1 Tax=Halalkalibacterium halodurans TaxID=86665 RepID=UPI002E1F6646|nr:phage tail spike protein [Halalkalibacterium halodurans]MED4124158.1 phage tail spike protein [Halalkalibacterium halodurans]